MEAVRAKRIIKSHFSLPCIALFLLTLALYLTSLYSYLLFHTLAEIFCLAISCAIFIFAWNTRQIQDNHFFLFLGIAFLSTGLTNLAHGLAFQEMNLIAGIVSENPACQLWIAARYLEGLSLLLAFLFLRRKLHEYTALAAYLAVTAFIFGTVFSCRIFPECWSAGKATAFKQNSEYFVLLLYAASLLLLRWQRAFFNRDVLRLMEAGILFAAAAELFFTLSGPIASLPNFVAHFFRLFSSYSIYRAVIETSLAQPYNQLFRELNAHKEDLESKVQERTAALVQSAESLREEAAERRRAEQDLRRELAVNQVLAEVSDTLLAQPFSLQETEELIARAAKELTGSVYACSMAAEQSNSGGPDQTWDNVLQGFYTNEIASHDQPGGSEALQHRNYLQAPAVIDGRAVGKIALADKPADYTSHDLAAIERLAAVFALSIQRKQMEESLNRSERKYRSLFNDAPDMIHIVGQDKRIIDVNPAELLTLGYSKEELVGTLLSDIVHPNFKTVTAQMLERIFATGSCVQNYETALLSKGGERIDVEVSAMPQIENGEAVSVRAIIRNITERKKQEAERKKLETQLRQSRKMEAIGTLAGGIAHDFNNILGPILGYTDMALESLPGGSRAVPWLQEVRRAGGRARDLVKQILTISRKTEQELQPLKIQIVIKETLKLLRSSIPSTIEIRQHLDPDCGAVMADPTRIHQVVMNLCTNAYHAMRERGGLLEVSLRQIELSAADMPPKLRLPPGDYLRLAVRDTGCGIPEEILEKIFEPYFTTKAKGEGTGLGLALVQSIALDFGGDISVYSELGKGTVFQIYLPVIKTEQEDCQDQDMAPLPGGRERILVVDDDPDFAAMSRNILASLGYQAEILNCSLEGLAVFEQQPDGFDLVLTDMTMPRMTGDELAKRMLALRPGLPVILCTGFSELIDEKKAAEIGIRRLLMKPFTKRELARTVREVLDCGAENCLDRAGRKDIHC
jgi:PAS domain S-box-containing protein